LLRKVADYISVGSYFIDTKDSESPLLHGMGLGKIVVADYISVGSYFINAKESQSRLRNGIGSTAPTWRF
jgi:hypothetical protein